MAKNKEHLGDNIQEALKALKASRTDKEIELIELVSNMYENFKVAKDKAAQRVNDAAQTLDDSVHEKPWHYIGGAAIVAFLLGLFIHRK